MSGFTKLEKLLRANDLPREDQEAAEAYGKEVSDHMLKTLGINVGWGPVAAGFTQGVVYKNKSIMAAIDSIDLKDFYKMHKDYIIDHDSSPQQQSVSRVVVAVIEMMTEVQAMTKHFSCYCLPTQADSSDCEPCRAKKKLKDFMGAL